MKKLFAAVALVGLVIIGLGAIKDESDTIRYRQGAVLSFDPQTTIKNEDGAWTGNGNILLGMVASNATYGSWAVSNLTVNGTTNQITFGGTNSTPTTATNIFWVAVRLAGDTNTYRIALSK